MTTRSLRCSCEQTHCTGTTAMWAGCDTKPGRGPYPVCGDSRGAVGSREYALFACSRPAESIPAATAAQAPPQSAHRGGEPTISARLFDSLKKRNFLKNRSDSELSAEEEARKRCEGRGHEHGQHVVLHAASVDVAPAPHFFARVQAHLRPWTRFTRLENTRTSLSTNLAEHTCNATNPTANDSSATCRPTGRAQAPSRTAARRAARLCFPLHVQWQWPNLSRSTAAC